jgi:chromosome partitioning protein
VKPRVPFSRRRILAIANQKGGVGKTTTAINLAASLAAAEKRVLLMDLDPQGNAGSGVGYPKHVVEAGVYDLLLGDATLDSLILPTELPTLEVVPASRELAGAEIELVNTKNREFILRDVFANRDPNAKDWDFVILDCPPSLGLLTVNALVAANAVLIPMLARYFSLEGLGSLRDTIDRIRAAWNPKLEVDGIVFCLAEKRTNLAQQVTAEVRRHFPREVFEVEIPQNIRLSESPSFGKPALLYDIDSKGAQAYLAMASELLARLEEKANL